MDTMIDTYKKKERSSNLELYRIVCMLLIVAHHFAGNFGILGADGPVREDVFAPNSIFMYLFGMWGKTGINCFVLITGYFMCTSNITVRKFIKLYLWVITYRIIITLIFLIAGQYQVTWESAFLLIPFRSIHSDSFISAFMIWWLFIPFLNALVNNIGRKQHLWLIVLLVTCFSIYPTIPVVLKFQGINPICWFSVLYVIASYFRKYPEKIYKSSSRLFWGVMTLISVLISMASVMGILWVNKNYGMELPCYHFVSDSHKLLALLVAVCSFILFKNMHIGYSKVINKVGGATFGVLLFHTMLPMRQWLWNDVFLCVDHFDLPIWKFLGYSISVVAIVFIMGIIADSIRLKMIEEPVFKYFDKRKILINK